VSAVSPSALLLASAAFAADPSTILVEAPAGVDPAATSAAVTVIDVADSPASSDLATAIEAAPGANVRQLGGLGDWSGVSIRGSSFRQVQVDLDGIPLNPDGSSAVNLAELPLWAFSRVEVWRGAAPAELAAAPIGGVVNLVTGEPKGGRIAVSTGSLGTERVDLARGWTAAGRIPGDYLVFGEVFSTRDGYRYFDDGGTRFEADDDAFRTRTNDDKVQLAVHARVRLGDDRLRLVVQDASLVREEGLPGPASRPAAAARLATSRHALAVQLDGGDAVRSTLRGWGQLRTETLDDRAGEIGVGTRWQDDRTSTMGLVAITRVPLPTISPSLTGDLRRDVLTTADRLGGPDGPIRHRWSGSIAASSPVFTRDRSLVATPVVLVQWLDDAAIGAVPFGGLPTSEGGKVRLPFVAPRLGALWHPAPAWSLKANAGRYLRPPDLDELFGDRGALRGNADLVPEHGASADVGARWAGDLRAGAVSIELTGFASSATDLITWVQNSQQTLVPVNIGRADTRGIELAGDADLGGRVRIGLSATATRAVNRSANPTYDGKVLPRVPAFEADERVLYHRERWSIGQSFSYTAGNTWDQANWFWAPPRALIGLDAAFHVDDRLTVELDALNLGNRITDVVPADPLNPGSGDTLQPVTDFIGWPLPGRTFLASLTWELP
jgi:vitamin B12 transporter